MLRNPVHFVCPPELLWRELRDGDFPLISTTRLTECSGGILNSWIVRTYYQLGLAGASVTTSGTLRHDAINLVSTRDFGRKHRPINAFVVIPRGDAHVPMLANYVIEQNNQSQATRCLSAIPHWPQPGILPRERSRGSLVRKVSFKGRTRNLDEHFRSQAFRDALSEIEIELELDAIETLTGDHNWNDYRDCDAVIAVRNIRGKTAFAKPASKLVNAWHGQTVPLLGPEPAFREIRQSELDYIEIFTTNDALKALKFLKNKPNLYKAIIENGRKRSLEYTDEVITRYWIETLNGPISEEYEKWKRKSFAKKFFDYVHMMVEEPKARAAYVNEIRSGTYLFDMMKKEKSIFE